VSGVSGGSSDWGLAKTTAVPLLAASAQGLHWGEDHHLALRDHGGEQGSDARDFFGDCNTARKEHSQAAVAVTCHVLPRRCRSVVRLFSPVLVLILMGLVPGRVAVFDFRVHEYMAVRDKMSSSPVDLPAASYSVPRRTPRTMVSKFHDREEIRRR
jgi:hypothetical protein